MSEMFFASYVVPATPYEAAAAFEKMFEEDTAENTVAVTHRKYISSKDLRARRRKKTVYAKMHRAKVQPLIGIRWMSNGMAIFKDSAQSYRKRDSMDQKLKEFALEDNIFEPSDDLSEKDIISDFYIWDDDFLD